jgi:hypothetical protein
MGGTPALQSAVSRFPEFGQFGVDSVKRTKNSDGSPIGRGHVTGNAVDVGVPDNEAGFNYIIAAIRSGQFAEIGTNPKWIPQLQPLASYFGVKLFSDYKQVHAHLQVGF